MAHGKTMESFEKLSSSETQQETIEQLQNRLHEFVIDQKEEVEKEMLSGRIKHKKLHHPSGADLEEAREIIIDFLKNGVKPYVSVPEKFADQVRKHGLLQRPMKNQPEREAIIGVLGTDPLLPANEKRVLFEVDTKDVDARFTGPENIFNGTVEIKSSVPPEQLREVTKPVRELRQ